MECIHLAQRGAGAVSPNPMVGAVLVNKGKVIGRGYHKRFGGPHAEVNAIRSATSSVAGSTLYVNLEPCQVYGKTPPCTNMIIESHIKRVIIGMLDPNPHVSGRGVRELRKHGIEVITGVLKDECRKLNEAFTKYITTKTPFVVLKIAQTLDGNIADVTGKSQWLTNIQSRTLVHQLRSLYDAVIVGAGTVNNDNPSLTVRHVKGRNPIRVVIDRKFSVRPSAKVFSGEATTIVFTSKEFLEKNTTKRRLLENKGVEIIPMEDSTNGAYNLKQVLSILGVRGIASVFVEGGATMFSLFLQQQLTDKILFFLAPKILGNGLASFEKLTPRKLGKEIRLTNISVQNIDDDVLVEAYCTTKK